jgi:hypothetical protein
MNIINVLKLKLTQYRVQKKFKKLFKKVLGYSLNLRNPKTYCEKIQWLKFNHNANDEKVINRADKYAVRKFIESKGFGEHLITLYGNWEQPEQIDWQQLPNRFVLKLNNGSGKKYLWFVKDKSLFSIKKFEAEVKAVMHIKYDIDNCEYHYWKMLPMIIAEEYFEDTQEGILDYKFYCFNGEIAFLSVGQGTIQGAKMVDYYTTDWDKSPVKFFADHSGPKQPYEKPDNFDQMIFIAKTLSKGYPHIRVDLYNIAGKVYFGELTYTPENGMTQWNPKSLDLEYGKLMDIHNISH